MAAGIVVVVLAIAGVLAPFVYLRARRNKLPVKFKDEYELATASSVVWWARDQIGAADPGRKVLWSLPTSSGHVMRFLFVGWSAEALAVLAPFIDRMIAGNGPPWPLPAEYDDRAEVLSAFKARMQAEGVWPV